MHLHVSQQMRMSQQMKLAPRMIQSMEILQLPTMELQERIDQELAENFLLEQLNPEPGGPTPDMHRAFDWVVRLELHFFGDAIMRNAKVLFSGNAEAAPADPRTPGPLPVLGPPAAGPITHLELRPLDGCRPEAVSGATSTTCATR